MLIGGAIEFRTPSSYTLLYDIKLQEWRVTHDDALGAKRFRRGGGGTGRQIGQGTQPPVYDLLGRMMSLDKVYSFIMGMKIYTVYELFKTVFRMWCSKSFR